MRDGEHQDQEWEMQQWFSPQQYISASRILHSSVIWSHFCFVFQHRIHNLNSCNWNATACISVFNKYESESRRLIFPAQARESYDWICWVINIQLEPLKQSKIQDTVSLYATEISTSSRWCHPGHTAETLKSSIYCPFFFFLNQCKTLVEFIGGMEETGVLRKRCQILEQDHEGTSVESFEMSSNEKPSG